MDLPYFFRNCGNIVNYNACFRGLNHVYGNDYTPCNAHDCFEFYVYDRPETMDFRQEGCHFVISYNNFYNGTF